MSKSTIIFALLLLLIPAASRAAPAQSGSWTLHCGNPVTSSPRGSNLYCYTPASGAGLEVATPILDVSHCENVDVFHFDDFDGDATACTVGWDIESCPPGANTLATDALKNAACNSLQGATSLSGDDVESNLAGSHLRFHGLNAGTNITSCQIVLKCALEAEGN